jgi:cytochrome c biogenesis protein CcmG, thiol:disulfide interchange protein DsbE
MNGKRMLLGLVITVPIIALLAAGLGRDPRLIPSPLPGREAPAFALPVMQTSAPYSVREPGPGEVVHLADLRGDVVVLNFWASWCLTCRTEHVPLSNLADRYRGQGVHFFRVLYNDRADNAAALIERVGGQSYPTLLDSRSGTAIRYGLTGVPETFFIARDGTVAHKQVGPVSHDLIVQWVDRLLADEWAGEAGGDSLEGTTPSPETSAGPTGEPPPETPEPEGM